MSQEFIIKLNRKKTSLILLGGIVLTIISVLFVLNPKKYKSFIFFREEAILYTGIIGLIFFGIASIYIGYRLFTNQTGIIVNDRGIYDNTTLSSVGWINWEDITDIEIYKVPTGLLMKNSISMVLVKVKEPDKYMMPFSSFKRNILNLNYKNYGTPITINTNGLSYSSIELLNILTDRLNKSK
ncbi:STM3941 family protein [Chryseobacterium sp. MDT2-18]|uniref:STM3941 family protein n=1 Tax=Chryseobacterium sp. MDT2-18 TaxID=1259136 RepID=UPI0027890B75|nr:STM3941 family protein [Chryseobacterium sp. MDT2-18]MDQ0478270.1 hypothetical protein [Chryseobacterium sp. MDT2-18]